MDSFRTPERVKVRHILLKTDGKPASEEPKIKAKAEDLLKQIRGGADFAALAKKNSEDTGSAANGGEYPGLVTRGQTVPEFEKAAFSLKPGQTSDLVKTQYGYHIIQVLQHEDARLRPFEEAKSELAVQAKKQTRERCDEQDLRHGPGGAAEGPGAPGKGGGRPEHATGARGRLRRAGQTVKEIGPNPDFDQAVAALKKGEASQLLALPDNKVALALVTDVMPPRPQTFEEVQNQIRDTIIAEQAGDGRAEPRQRTGGEGQVDGRRPGEGGQDDGPGSEDLGRNRPVGYGGRAGLRQLRTGRFHASRWNRVWPHLHAGWNGGGQGGPARRSGHCRNCRSSGSTLRDEIKSQKARDRNSLFEAGLRDALIKQGKIKIHQDVINRLLASYRG